MAGPHKIKRSNPNKLSYRARPHPLSVILGVLLVAALVFVGISIYQPVLDYFANRANRPEVSLPELEDPDPAANGGEETPAEPETPPPPEQVEGLRAVYAPTDLVRDSAAFAAFLDTLAGSEINAVMLDIKDANGSVLFNARSASATAWGTIDETPYDLDAAVAALEQRGLHLIARMSAFRDEPAARADIDNAIHYQDSETMLWLDNYADAGGKPWLNPYAPGTQNYITELAVEAVERGAVMVVLIDYQFPDGSLDANVGFMGYDTGSDRTQVLRDFAQSLGDQLAEQGARLALYYPTTTFTQGSANAYRFGGDPEALLGGSVELQLGLLPYQFSSNYDSEDGLVIEQPLSDPAATVRAALQYVQARLGGDVSVSALLQGGNESSVSADYSEQTVRSQIEAASGLGAQEYLLYCTDAAAYLIPGN